MSEPLGISRGDVAHLAGLARIELTDAELDHLVTELPSILEYVAAVQQAAGDDVEAMSHRDQLLHAEFRRASPDFRVRALAVRS